MVDGELGFRNAFHPRGGDIPAGQYVHVVLTRSDDTQEMVGFVDGEEVWRFEDTDDDYVITSHVADELVKFFVEFSFPNDNGFVSAGDVALIRAYEQPLSEGQVRTVG